jgi:hypothetical protein
VKFRSAAALCIMPLFLIASAATGAAKPAGQTVDSGSFGIFVNGQRVATERFSIQQTAAGSTADSQLHEEGSSEKASQNSSMQLTAKGELVRYEWHEISPEKLDLELLPNDQFLIERLTVKPGEKPIEQPFLLPSSTVVLDNNFFVHRELLAWRYLAQNCKQVSGKFQCVSGPISFGVVVPQDRASMRVTMEPVGKEKVQIAGKERELARFDLKFEDNNWSLWLDDQDHFKIVKIAIGNEKTEVVRD